MIRWLTAAVVLALVAPPVSAEPLAGRITQIGLLSAVSADQDLCRDMLRKGLSELGYVEGRMYQLELRYADDRSERIAELTADLVERKVDVIIVASATAVEAASKATKTIPIVMASSFYPIDIPPALDRAMQAGRRAGGDSPLRRRFSTSMGNGSGIWRCNSGCRAFPASPMLSRPARSA
jgi:DNA-binding LacI/PurR family transcriptional regulator